MKRSTYWLRIPLCTSQVCHRHAAEKMSPFFHVPCSKTCAEKNGFNKPQRESGRHVAHSGVTYDAVSGPFVNTFCWWLNGAMKVALQMFNLGYLPLLDALPRMTFSLQEEIVTTGRGGFHPNHELPPEWCSCEDKGAVLPLMHFRIAVPAQTDMIMEYTICVITHCHQLEQVVHLQNATCIMSFSTFYLSYLKSISSQPWFAWMTQPEDMVKSIENLI